MKIIQVSQTTERDEWLAARRGLSTGTKSGDIALEPYAQTDVGHILDMKASAESSAQRQSDLADKAQAQADAKAAESKELSEKLSEYDKERKELQGRKEDAEKHLETVKAPASVSKWRKELETCDKQLAAIDKASEKDDAKGLTLDGKAKEYQEKVAKYKAEQQRYLDKAKDYQDKADQARYENERLKSTAGYWQFVAENFADSPLDETPMERGHRLENENARLTCEALGIPDSQVNYDPGIWQSDIDPRIACSPDVHENSLEPTWAIECKSLGSANHLMYTVPIILHRMIRDSSHYLESIVDNAKTVSHLLLPDIVGKPETRDYDFVPDKYKTQVLQYFVVNEHLETLYFTFYDDRIYNRQAQHVFLTIQRDSIDTEIARHRDRQKLAIKEMDSMIQCVGFAALKSDNDGPEF